MGNKKYLTEEERKEARKKAWKKYNQTHNYLQKIKKENPIKYRATLLIISYYTKDKEKNRGKGDLTVQWVIDNIMMKPCAHCGKTGWNVIGCNRLDNSKPHTMDNVEPCCFECNNELNYENRRKKVYQYTINGELVGVWKSARYAAKTLGYKTPSAISKCCYGKGKTYKGFKWSY